jgi:hypothetical protein
LRPVTFGWSATKVRDLGFAAEQVAEIEPLLATYGDDGEVEGVKYKQITTVLVNAVNEQQLQIDAQQKLIQQQQRQIDALKELVCRQNQQALICTQ